MMRRSLLSFVVLSLIAVVQAVSSSGSRLLVLLEEASEKDKYSQLWGDLEGRGFTLTVESPKNEPVLFDLGERLYDHILLLPPKSKGLGPSLTPQILLDFIKHEGNILLALSANSPTPSAITSLLLELDINLPADRNALVVDHFEYDTLSAAEKHDVLLVPQPKASRQDLQNFFAGDGVLAVPRAVAQILGNGSPLLTPILNAPSTAYSYNPKDEGESMDELFGAGNQLSLVSALQARNSARFTILGSAELLEDAWFGATVKSEKQKSKSKTANREFAKALSAWTFKELGVLKVGTLQHHLSEGKASALGSNVSQTELNPKIYRIKNDVAYSIELSEYSYDKYIPFTPPAGDSIQLEVTMLSPFHRLNLKQISKTASSATYGTSFKLPDQHGIFNFRVNYKRPFLTNVDEKRTVTVRHFAHDEWPRSYNISGAFVWMAGIFVTVVGWLGFCVLWLFNEPAVEEKKRKKAQ